MGWTSDWLYHLIFKEVADVWASALANAVERPDLFGPGPELLTVHECGGVRWKNVQCLDPVTREWVYGGRTFVEQETVGEYRAGKNVRLKAFYSRPVLQFHITPDRTRVAITYVLGSRYGRGFVLAIEGQGKEGRLVPDQTASGWIA
jgi:hypothetical protein